MIESPFLSEFPVGREDLQQFLGFLLREQLQDELLIGSSSGRPLLPLMFCSSFIYLFILFPLCLKLYRNTVHVCHTTPALYVASVVYCPVCALQDFSGLDGVVKQRRQEMTESSSSGSQTPDYDKINGMNACSSETAIMEDKVGFKHCNYQELCKEA